MARKWFAEESGNTILLAALSMFVILSIAGLAIDGGMVYLTKAELQKTANAAVLSGAQELTNNEVKVEEVVRKVVAAHKDGALVDNLSIELEKKVTIDLSKKVNLAFSKLLGFEAVDVKAHSAAELRTMGRAAGAAPLGIDDSIPLEFNKEYQLKVDTGGVEYGNFGVLALGDTGARPYEENLRNGYQNELSVGDVVITQTGNIAGKTRNVVQEKVNSCPEFPRDIHSRDCSRILLVPVYQPYSHDVNQVKEVKITGFAYFYITDPMDSHDTSIKGMFIKRAGTGYEGEAAAFNGAYSIRITE
ncbi:pilus assembly protein TadG-related protein [Mesobacillus subterraneus]|uniref:pilus assembly protein TadG-related protein n=1 Tax=Mesobacillus subterraneus TaxID=285983 RepID=UPI001CFF12D0|nr:Tad domain-containing protein [Mesobacillus subterraneus]